MEKVRGDFRTFDTWFDSSISELAACNYRSILFEDNGENYFERNFPCSIRPQGKEIVRTWLYYTVLRSYHLFKSPPFNQVWISGLIRDPYGGKMSKSSGNTVDQLLFLQPTILPKNTPEILKPNRESWKIIAEKESSPKFSLEKTSTNFYYGADSVRLTSCLQGSHGTDIKFSLSKLDGNSKFLTKLWNIARFISSFPNEIKPDTITPTDDWILSSLDALIHRCNEGYSELNFAKPAENIYNWVWNIFTPHYIELVKHRAYNGSEEENMPRKSAHYTLHRILTTILKMIAPITPFVTEYIFQEIYQPSGSIHMELLTKSEKGKIEEDKRTFDLMNLNSFLWKIKREKGLSLKDAIPKVSIPKSLKDYVPDLIQMHNIQNLSISHKKNLKNTL